MAKNAKRADGRVQVRVFIGHDPSTGKKKYKSFYGRSTAEAKAKADAFQRDIENGYNPLTADTSMSEWSDQWFRTYKISRAYNTQQKYKNSLMHINNYFGHMRLRDITQTDVQGFANTLDGYSYDHIHAIRTALNQVLEKAIDNGMLLRNPSRGVDYPSGSRGQHRLLEEYEIDLIRNHWNEYRSGLWFMLMMYAGLRRGEVCALQWNDIDWKKKEINIRASVHFEGNKAKLGATKTPAGVRDIPICLPLYRALEQHRFLKKNPFICHSAYDQILSKTSFESC